MKIYHRKYPERQWDYRAVSEMFDGKEIIYYQLYDKGRNSAGLEVYSGRNYIMGDNRRSYSRKYDLQNIPEKYRLIKNKLLSGFHTIEWSTADRVNLN